MLISIILFSYNSICNKYLKIIVGNSNYCKLCKALLSSLKIANDWGMENLLLNFSSLANIQSSFFQYC